ncbi:uncharacterized protein LOC124190794 [Daphnia pulex]|uniref:uncharacterized protein LOC124190794 n=1 Tax=Daphnia pulex TaxID=6669 RepID=UPI001EDD580D|nr:uncharacterized protein LOC124190794 [Daphnia pulex]
MKNSLFLVRKKRKMGVITSLDESDQEQPTEEEEVLSDTDEDETNTNDTEEVIRARAEYEKSKENLAKIKRLYELAVSRLEEIENGVLSAYVATPEEVELDRWFEVTNRMENV